MVQRLITDNHHVIVVDNESATSSDKFNWFDTAENHKIDILDREKMESIFSSGIDYVFHLAARFANELSVKNPIDDLNVNAGGTLQVLLESIKQEPKRFVYASSSSLYGPQKLAEFSEMTQPNPSTPYAVSKLMGEYYCNAMHELYGLNYNVVRLSNSYGPFDPSGKFRNVIPNFIDSAIHERNIVITGSGNETRDFTYVDDCVDGIILAANSYQKNQIYNLGTGKETRIKKIAELIIKYTSSKSKIVYKTSRSFDHIKKRKMNICKAKNELGYSPKISIEEGLKKTSNWFLDR